MLDKDFLGRNVLFVQRVVEDRQDPQAAYECCVGIHTDNKEIYSNLHVATYSSITSSGISGLGSSPGFIVEGTWVFGYFRDGYAMQEPMIIGTLPGKPVELADTSKGFYDPNGVYPRYKNEVDTNRLATNDSANPHLGLELRNHL